MARARNIVISGDYQGKTIGCFGNKAYLALGFHESLDLDSNSIRSVRLLGSDSQVSVSSAATRGFIGEMLFGPLGLTAAATAERVGIHTVELEFRDGKRSVIEVDDKRYEAIVTSCQ